jgi:hypothetical protein
MNYFNVPFTVRLCSLLTVNLMSIFFKQLTLSKKLKEDAALYSMAKKRGICALNWLLEAVRHD